MKQGNRNIPPDPDLVKILACPECGHAVSWNDDLHEIQCAGCGLGFPVENGIPVMLIERTGKTGKRD